VFQVENKNGGGTYVQPFYKEFQKQETHKEQEKQEKQEKQEPKSTEKVFIPNDVMRSKCFLYG